MGSKVPTRAPPSWVKLVAPLASALLYPIDHLVTPVRMTPEPFMSSSYSSKCHSVAMPTVPFSPTVPSRAEATLKICWLSIEMVSLTALSHTCALWSHVLLGSWTEKLASGSPSLTPTRSLESSAYLGPFLPAGLPSHTASALSKPGPKLWKVQHRTTQPSQAQPSPAQPTASVQFASL